MATEALIFKGIGRGSRRALAISIPHHMELDQLLKELRTRLQESQGFFRGSPVLLEGRPLSAAERRLVAELVTEFGMELSEADGEGLAADAPGAAESRGGSGPRQQAESRTRGDVFGGQAAVPPPDDRTLLVRRTLRSGQRIFYPGNVVILGDVNPGAEVTCTGDIVVMGRLRGVAHAGAGGNVGARVMAFRLQPTQLRIAHYISRAPDGTDEEPAWPEVASVNDGVIEIQAFTP